MLVAVSETWRERSDEVRSQARDGRADRPDASSPSALARTPPSADDSAAALDALTRQYDYARGGFGGAPKFPPSMVLEFLLRHHARTGSADALLMAEGTLRAMAGGGIYDQLAGGFARYSVDADWVVPHFEKMLYDNALLARVALHLGQVTGRDLGRRRRRETADFLLRRPAAPPKVASRPRSTPTPRGSRGATTSGRRQSSSTCSARTTVRGRPTCSR